MWGLGAAIWIAAISGTIGTGASGAGPSTVLVIDFIIGILTLAAIYVGVRALQKSKAFDAEVKAREAAESLSNTYMNEITFLKDQLSGEKELTRKQAEIMRDLHARKDIQPFVQQIVHEFSKMNDTMATQLSEHERSAASRSTATLDALHELANVFSAYRDRLLQSG